MRNEKEWKPTKFEFRNENLIASRDSRQVGVGSRVIVDIVASYYQQFAVKYITGKVLDLGCGKVPLWELYKKNASESICLDWAQSPHSEGAKHLDLLHDLNEPLPFVGGVFDTVILSDVLEHIAEPKNLILEVSRILKPEGCLVLNVPFYYWIHEGPHDYFRYTKYALKKFAKEANLDVVMLEEIGGAPEILVDVLSKVLCTVPKIGWRAASFLNWLHGLFMKFRFARKISTVSKSKFPLGYFLVARKPLSDVS